MTIVNTETGELVEPLTDQERDALAEAESEIDDGVKMVGQALAGIRDGRLYRESHSSFDGYCSSRWGISRSTAHRRIAAAEVAEILSPIGDSREVDPTPRINESQARELAPLRSEPEVVRSIYADVQRETQGRPTASAIRQSVKRHLSPVPASPQDEQFWNEAAQKATESGWVAKRDAERPFSLAVSGLVLAAADITSISLSPQELAANIPAHDIARLPDIEAAAEWLNTFIAAHKESA